MFIHVAAEAAAVRRGVIVVVVVVPVAAIQQQSLLLVWLGRRCLGLEPQQRPALHVHADDCERAATDADASAEQLAVHRAEPRAISTPPCYHLNHVSIGTCPWYRIPCAAAGLARHRAGGRPSSSWQSSCRGAMAAEGKAADDFARGAIDQYMDQ